MQRPGSWPLYLIGAQSFGTGHSSSLPLALADLFLVTTSLSFARCVCRHLTSGRICTQVIRVTQYNGWLLVDANATKVVRNLDKLHRLPDQSVAEDAYCKLCIKASKTVVMARWEIVGINAAYKEPCQAHQANWCPQYIHEVLKLNTVSTFRSLRPRQEEVAAYRSAKAEWIGQLFFTRVFRNRLPDDVLSTIQDFAQ